jgi:(methylthio)acryloyl-CoA hydratase
MQNEIPALPPSLTVEPQSNGIWIVTLNRPEKRNALDDATIAGIESLFANLPESVTAVVLEGAGEHFCSLTELLPIASRGKAFEIPHRLAAMMPRRHFPRDV